MATSNPRVFGWRGTEDNKKEQRICRWHIRPHDECKKHNKKKHNAIKCFCRRSVIEFHCQNLFLWTQGLPVSQELHLLKLKNGGLVGIRCRDFGKTAWSQRVLCEGRELRHWEAPCCDIAKAKVEFVIGLTEVQNATECYRNKWRKNQENIDWVYFGISIWERLPFEPCPTLSATWKSWHCR